MTARVNLEQALLDPAGVFESPEEVRDHTALTTGQKIEILRRWVYDENEIAVAEEEGMLGGNPPMLKRVLVALEELGASIDGSTPTKHDGS
ncbi:MAG: hypothetical protein P8Y01_07705 [Woeseiaceae bacterium]|jgi:hypothetical protein